MQANIIQLEEIWRSESEKVKIMKESYNFIHNNVMLRNVSFAICHQYFVIES